MQKTGCLPDASERSYAIIVAALGFLAGCRLALHLRAGLWLLLAAALCAFAALLMRGMGRSARAALFLCMLSLGAYWAGDALTPQAPAPGTYEITGYVSGGGTPRSDRRISFALCDIELDGVPVDGRAYCTYYYNDELPTLFDGAELRFTGRVYEPDGKSGEPRFDFRLWMYQSGYRCGVAISRGLTILNTPDTAPIRDAAFRVREAFGAALRRTMGADARIAMAMLFSDREGMTDEEDQAFRTLGIAHILAVSGLHVGLLGGMLMALLDRLRMRRAWQLPIVAVFLLDYCALTGFTASSIRAAVMLLLVLIARTLGRKPDPLTTLAAAMLVVLALNPLQAYAAGFILSFASVAGITLLFPVFRDALERVLPQPEPVKYARRSRWRRFTDWLGRTLGRPAELIAISLSAQLGVLAPTAVFFNRLPLYGVFINLLVVPYTAILVAAFALALLLSPVPLLGMGMGWLAAVLGKGLLWAVELMSALPYASVRVPTVPAAISCALAACLIVFSRRVRLKPLKRLLCAALCAIIGIAGAYAAALHTACGRTGGRGACDGRRQDNRHRRGRGRSRDPRLSAVRRSRRGRADTDASALRSRGRRAGAAGKQRPHQARVSARECGKAADRRADACHGRSASRGGRSHHGACPRRRTALQ